MCWWYNMSGIWYCLMISIMKKFFFLVFYKFFFWKNITFARYEILTVCILQFFLLLHLTHLFIKYFVWVLRVGHDRHHGHRRWTWKSASFWQLRVSLWSRPSGIIYRWACLKNLLKLFEQILSWCWETSANELNV